MTAKHNAYPPFLYRDYEIDTDDLLEGLFESSVLSKAAPECRIVVAYLTELISSPSPLHRWPDIFLSLQALPDEECMRSTRTGNAALNGMTKIAPATIAYVATQVIASGLLQLLSG